jgi:hypothetical protein
MGGSAANQSIPNQAYSHLRSFQSSPDNKKLIVVESKLNEDSGFTSKRVDEITPIRKMQ